MIVSSVRRFGEKGVKTIREKLLANPHFLVSILKDDRNSSGLKSIG